MNMLIAIISIAAIVSSSALADDKEYGPYIASPRVPAVCPGGYQLSSIASVKGYHVSPVAIWCRSIIHPNKIAGSEVSLTAKEAPNNGAGLAVSCKPGWRVSRLQLHVDPSDHARSVTIWCVPFSNATPASNEPEEYFVTREPKNGGSSALINIPKDAYIPKIEYVEVTLDEPYARGLQLWAKKFPKP